MKKIWANKIRFWLNDKLIETECLPSETALELIHRQGFSSVKEVCSEGDCGACTVAIGMCEENGFHYKSVTSCIYPATKLHGTHVLTTEGLGTPEKMHIIQSKLYENHASQCGFCTPGIVMSVFALLAENPEPTLEEFKTALEGNLCRCTGYRHIVIAGEELIAGIHAGLIKRDDIIPAYAKEIQADLESTAEAVPPKRMTSREIERPDHLPVNEYLKPDNLKDALKDFTPETKIIAGATDLFVEANIRRQFHKRYLDVSEVSEMLGIGESDGKVRIGASVTQEEVARNPLIKQYFPALCETIGIMSSRQIRNVATFAGNICNASPIADGTSALLGLNAEIELTNTENIKRIIPLREFYKGYKKTERRENEILTAIYLPIVEYTYSGFIKSSKRKNVDISSVNSCLSIVLKDNRIEDVVLSYGGVKEYPALALSTMQMMKGEVLNDELLERAMDSVEKEFTPISDVRGSAHYRGLLIRNHLKKHFLRIGK